MQVPQSTERIVISGSYADITHLWNIAQEIFEGRLVITSCTDEFRVSLNMTHPTCTPKIASEEPIKVYINSQSAAYKFGSALSPENCESVHTETLSQRLEKKT